MLSLLYLPTVSSSTLSKGDHLKVAFFNVIYLFISFHLSFHSTSVPMLLLGLFHPILYIHDTFLLSVHFPLTHKCTLLNCKCAFACDETVTGIERFLFNPTVFLFHGWKTSVSILCVCVCVQVMDVESWNLCSKGKQMSVLWQFKKKKLKKRVHKINCLKQGKNILE